MANHVSSLKRARQTIVKTEVNRANRTRVRGSLRLMREALTAGDVAAAQTQFRATVSALDKSVQKGVLHKNTVSRYKSRLNARLKTLATSTPAPAATKAPAKAKKAAAKKA
jgi:small subunit ribosomal protein S20